ncbi:MAG: hypothetical protein UX04_C0002G0023 [Microgenomates group bacterium GW2011_GWF2_45_18]|nr:MAG: hypothetical protein UW18_C0001G0074 [Microgenomates group bacterium GW2011_GWF1_44_10]KKU01880.1 MAG: hypothetical protein UX04_C0002G0023 [Microgenomates group bacterium GW2011_GWF2_45_18]OGJ40673.1 MAG: hypothetical protein A2378_01385 [Candidatus Pacebacteria bacterium RIFOXYB1_FULL_44_10]HAU98803.1 hypothetical protein [Candidatus Paceibacterota bacterium]HAX01377.1 hypothetical protein [Candidatus Paceibacterota bacterium]
MSAHSSSNHLSSTTQEFLDVLDITNNLVLLRDGTASMVMSASSVNFDLLSEEEQEAMIYTYAGILNSLSFPIQIVIRSQKKDISGYLGHLQETERGTHAPQKRAQIAQYREFVSTLVKERNILDKKFYLVISYQSSTLSSILPTSPFPFKKQKSTQESQINIPQLIEKAKTDLEPKRDHIISQLARIGIIVKQLNTQELIHIFYTIYNPGSSDGQIVESSKAYTSPVVQSR